MKAFRTPLPQNLRRTIASAQTIPNTVFTGTAIAVMISVSLNALSVSGVVSASQAGPEAVLEGAPEDDRERADEDDREVRHRDEAEPDPRKARPTHGRASSRSGGSRRSRAA